MTECVEVQLQPATSQSVLPGGIYTDEKQAYPGHMGHGARDHSRRPQSFAASGSSVVNASHSREAEEDSRQSSASSLRSPAVCSTSAYASREAATAGKHACGRHLESSGEPRAASWPGWENPARLLLSASTRFSVRPPLGRPQQPGAPPEHRLAPDAAKHGLPRATASRKPPAPRPASGDGRACSGGPGLGGLLFRHTEARHCRGVEGGALEQRPRQHHREVRARHPRSARLQRLAAFPRAAGPTGGRSRATTQGTSGLGARVLVVLLHLLEGEEADGRQPVPRAVRTRLMRVVRWTRGEGGWDQGVGVGVGARGRATG